MLDDSKDPQDDPPDPNPVVWRASAFPGALGELLGQGTILGFGRGREGGQVWETKVMRAKMEDSYLDVVVNEGDDDVLMPLRMT